MRLIWPGVGVQGRAGIRDAQVRGLIVPHHQSVLAQAAHLPPAGTWKLLPARPQPPGPPLSATNGTCCFHKSTMMYLRQLGQESRMVLENSPRCRAEPGRGGQGGAGWGQ